MPAPVHLLSIELRGFRNHGLTRLQPGAAPFVLLTGPNGAGKTNLLEAVSLLAVGRGLRAGAQRTASGAQGPDKIRQRLGRRLDGPGLRRAEGLMARFGAPLVTLSFLTIGVQTLLNAAAGALRMPLRHYTPSAVLGSLVWAGLYTTAGFVVLETIQGVLPWWALLAVVAGAGVVLLVTRALRGRVRG